MIYDALAYRSWNRAPPIDDRDRLSLLCYGHTFLGTTDVPSRTRRTERGVVDREHFKVQTNMITIRFLSLYVQWHVDRHFVERWRTGDTEQLETPERTRLLGGITPLVRVPSVIEGSNG